MHRVRIGKKGKGRECMKKGGVSMKNTSSPTGLIGENPVRDTVNGFFDKIYGERFALRAEDVRIRKIEPRVRLEGIGGVCIRLSLFKRIMAGFHEAYVMGFGWRRFP